MTKVAASKEKVGSLPASLLITFANSLDSALDQTKVEPYLDQTDCHSEGVPERIFEKFDFEKISR